MKKHLIILVICDGLGQREDKEHNAIAAAQTPHLNYLEKNFPYALLAASGEAIGFPPGPKGTSEANPFGIGSGRGIYHEFL